MSDQVIQFFNRYSGRMETEHIYGERWLRWAYQTRLGRLTTRTIASKVWFSRWYGWRMSKPSSARLIKPFMQKYAINADEMASQPEAFKSFNEFFFRHLKSAARPIAPESEAVIFPADGRHLGFNDYSAAKRFFIKGEQFDLVSLLGGAADAAELKGASVVLSRLCPVDYHRFHFPLECTPGQTELIPGPLYSVSPIALVRDISILARNRRAVTVLQTPAGRCWQVEIGLPMWVASSKPILHSQQYAKEQKKATLPLEALQ
ncbi:MAG: phosphatidylserine decarboxylase [Verrucomicrobia bacterium]|nr:phosphatidylserine decarboxylase [Verrucomicrobiota bacterium]